MQILAEDPKKEEHLTHYRLWKFAYMPEQYCNTFQEQFKNLKKIKEERQM